MVGKPGYDVLHDQPPFFAQFYSVPFYVLEGGVNGQYIKVKYNLDGLVDDDGNEVWLTENKIFNNSSTSIRLNIPYNLLSEYITIKIVNNDETCESEVIEIEVTEMR